MVQNDKVALVTGSSRGIGRAIASQLAREGYAVCVNYYERKDKADELVTQLTREGCRAIAVQADVARRAEVDAMLKTINDTLHQSPLPPVSKSTTNGWPSCGKSASPSATSRMTMSWNSNRDIRCSSIDSLNAKGATRHAYFELLKLIKHFQKRTAVNLLKSQALIQRKVIGRKRV